MDNPFKRSDYAKLCMSPSLDGTLPDYVISQEDNSPLTFVHRLTLYTIFNVSWIAIVLLIKFIHKCMHIHLSPNILKYKRRGKIHFHAKVRFCIKFVYNSIRQLYCDITDIRICRLRGRHTQNVFRMLLKNHDLLIEKIKKKYAQKLLPVRFSENHPHISPNLQKMLE